MKKIFNKFKKRSAKIIPATVAAVSVFGGCGSEEEKKEEKQVVSDKNNKEENKDVIDNPDEKKEQVVIETEDEEDNPVEKNEEKTNEVKYNQPNSLNENQQPNNLNLMYKFFVEQEIEQEVIKKLKIYIFIKTREKYTQDGFGRMPKALQDLVKKNIKNYLKPNNWVSIIENIDDLIIDQSEEPIPEILDNPDDEKTIRQNKLNKDLVYLNLKVSNIQIHPLESLSISDSQKNITIEAFQFEKINANIQIRLKKSDLNQIKSLTDKNEFYKQLKGKRIYSIVNIQNYDGNAINLPDITIIDNKAQADNPDQS
ncbi:hypothetical protein [Mycoplasma sp. SG1]|uniref:hypothetical protein n=1 Tax=Mycoplasma sp. SG1 TaxID=2810348 RepID=UPI002023F836|nr:hypothetical protein [Mycoplasma sp. SG1]URM53206.1 hypothetical protein JRW51_02565 [Mycoplasma sp. SG1]